MPYALLTIGLILFVSGIRGTNEKLWDLVKSDFTGQNNFLIWIAALAIVGGIGYIKPLKPLSVAFMTLLIVSLALKNGGVFQKFQDFVQNPSTSGTITNIAVTPLPPIPSLNESPIP